MVYQTSLSKMQLYTDMELVICSRSPHICMCLVKPMYSYPVQRESGRQMVCDEDEYCNCMACPGMVRETTLEHECAGQSRPMWGMRLN